MPRLNLKRHASVNLYQFEDLLMRVNEKGNDSKKNMNTGNAYAGTGWFALADRP